MSDVIADLVALISADTSGLKKGLGDSKGMLSSFAGGMKDIGKTLTAGFTIPAVAGFGLVIAEASKSENAISQLNAVLKSTSATMDKSTVATGYWSDGTAKAGALTKKYGDDIAMANAKLADMNARMADGHKLSNVAQLNYEKTTAKLNQMTGEINSANASGKKWVTTQQQQATVSHMTYQAYIELASGLERVTRFSDEAILGAESMLLTFTKIGKDVFPLATRTALDMSQALGQDLKSSSIQLGKALNDPIKGITALQRVGVTFSAEQKRMIANFMAQNKIMEAQKIILGELQTEFGGSAVAAGATFAGALDRLSNAFSNVLEAIGTPIINALSPVLNSAAKFTADLADEMSKLDPATITTTAGIIAMVAAIGPLMFIVGALISPLGLLVASVALVGAAIATNFGGIGDLVKSAYAAVKPALDQLKAAFDAFFSTLMQKNKPDIRMAKGDVGGRGEASDSAAGETKGEFNIGERISNAVAKAAPMVQAAIETLFSGLGQWISDSIAKIDPAVISSALGNLLTGVAGLIGQGLNPFGPQIQKAMDDAVKGVKPGEVAKTGIDAFMGKLGDWITADGSLLSGIKNGIQAALDWINGDGQKLAQAAATVLKNAIEGALAGVGSAIVAGVKAALKAIAAGLSILSPGTAGLINAAIDSIGGKASGGYTDAMRPYIVGERGPELFIPQTAGRVLPNGATSGGSGGRSTVVIENLYLQGINDPSAMLDALQKEAKNRNLSLVLA